MIGDAHFRRLFGASGKRRYDSSYQECRYKENAVEI